MEIFWGVIEGVEYLKMPRTALSYVTQNVTNYQSREVWTKIDILFPFFIKKENCWLERVTLIWKSYGESERDGDRSICWFVPQLTTRARTEPGTSTRSPIWVVGAQALRWPSFAAFLMPWAGNRTGSGAVKTWTKACMGCWPPWPCLYPVCHSACSVLFVLIKHLR